MVNIVKSIVFCLIQFAKMPILTAQAQQHLDRLSEEQRRLIQTQVGNRPVINQFIVKNGILYFLWGIILVCVSLQEENGVYQVWFNSQMIEFDISTGKCFIIDLGKSRLEYFCVGVFFQTATTNALYSFLYRLLIQERIDRIGGKPIRSLRIFFTPREVVGQIERAGNSSLKTPDGFLSINKMVRDVKLFVSGRFSSCFMMNRNLFRTAILENREPSSRPSVDERYGVRLFLNGKFEKHLQSFAIISEIMRRFLGDDSRMKGVFQKLIENRFFGMMIRSICSKITQNFIKNLCGFRQATGAMNVLLKSCRKKTNLSSSSFPVHSITGCVSDMIEMDNYRVKLSEKRSYERLIEQRHLEQVEYQHKLSIREFRGGIERMNEEVSQTQKRLCVLDEFADGGINRFEETNKRERERECEREIDEFEDVDSSPKIRKFE